MKHFLLILFLCCSLCSFGRTVSGTVFKDANSNGRRDNNERGIARMAVSDGDTVVLTDRKGRFTLETGSRHIFPIVSSEYYSGVSKIGNCNYILLPEGDITNADIALKRQDVKKSFRIAAVGDVQVNDSTELSYAARTIYSELSNRRDIDFSIYLGDLVNDDARLLSATAGLLSRMPHASWTVAGNHDLDKGSPREPETYREVFGPPDYAFNYGSTLFIVLDNVSGYGSKEYSGRLSDRQQRFVRNCLAITPDSYNVVMCVHVPIYGGKHQDEAVALFNGRVQVLILSGHTHMTSRHILAPNVCELVAGASCGSWWTGERGPDAVPLSLQRCGAPRNYYTVDFSKKGYSFAFKGVGLDKNTGMDIWIKGEEESDALVPGLSELPEGSVVANIYGGTDVTGVKARIDGGEWQAMEYSSMQAPVISRMIYWNKTAGYPTKYSRRTPFSKTVSPHTWGFLLPEGLPPGVHSIEIHAADGYGFETSYTREFIKR